MRRSRNLTLPSEIDAIVSQLNREWGDDSTVEDVAKAVLKAVDATRSTMWRPIGPPLKVGASFKSIFSSKTHYIPWIGEDQSGVEMCWVVTSDSDYGHLARVDGRSWQWTTPARVQQKTIDKVFTNELGMAPGDKVTLRQDGQYTVEAVFCRGALLRHRQTGMIWSETNSELKKNYKDGWK